MDYLKNLKADGRIEHVFIIGGGQVYADALQSPQCSAVHLTAVSTCQIALNMRKVFVHATPSGDPNLGPIGMQDSSIRAVDTPHHDICGDAITILQADAAASTLRVIHPDDEWVCCRLMQT